MQQNSQDALMNWILSKPCGYVSYSSIMSDYNPINSTYEQKQQFCDKKCNNCLYNYYPYTACKTIFEKRKRQYVEDIDGDKMLNISKMYKTFLKNMNEKTLLHFAQLLVDEMEVRGYDSQKN